MIKTEVLDGNLIRHYSDKGLNLLQIETDKVYSDAVDSINSQYTYIELETVVEEDAI